MSDLGGDILSALFGQNAANKLALKMEGDNMSSSEINEIVYGVTICRDGVVPLRWLDKPAKEYAVQHYEDGTIEVRPLGKWSYVVKATDDDVLELRSTGVGEDYIEVRHKGDGTIWLRPKDAAKRHGESCDKSIICKVNPGVADDYVKVYEYVRERLDEVVIDRRSDAHSRGYYLEKKNLRYIHDEWDRTYTGKQGLHNRPRDLKYLETKESYTPERWAEIQAEDERRRQYSKAYREKRKAIDAGLIPPTPRLLRGQHGDDGLGRLHER